MELMRSRYELRKIEDGGQTNTCWGDIESYHIEKSTLEKIERRGRKKRKKADEKKKSNDAAAEKLLRELQQKYANDKQKLGQEIMAFYKKEGVNPLGGCLPMILQMPFFLAFYWVLLDMVELRHAPFLLWITDLSSYDPFFVLPLLNAGLMYYSQKMMPVTPSSDPTHHDHGHVNSAKKCVDSASSTTHGCQHHGGRPRCLPDDLLSEDSVRAGRHRCRTRRGYRHAVDYSGTRHGLDGHRDLRGRRPLSDG